VTAIFFRIIPVIERQFFSGLNISKGENPDTASGEFCDTIRITGMVDVAGGVAEKLAINVVLSAEGKNIDIPLGYTLGTFSFGNAFPYIPNNPSVLLDRLKGKQPLACNTRFPNPYANFHHSISQVFATAIINGNNILGVCSEYVCFFPKSIYIDTVGQPLG
jgi:hypothetical protein